MSRQGDCIMRLTPFSSDDWCGESGGSEEDLITDYLGGEEMGEKTGPPGGPSPLVPTISVTPHSPAGKHYPILEDNLQQLHYIHESIQQMRDLTLHPVGSQEASRLSASCPSLHDAGSDPDLMSSVNSTPTQTLTLNAPVITRSIYSKRGSGEWELYRRNVGTEEEGEVSRRRSWAALEDLSHGKDSCRPGCQRRYFNFTLHCTPETLQFLYYNKCMRKLKETYDSRFIAHIDYIGGTTVDTHYEKPKKKMLEKELDSMAIRHIQLLNHQKSSFNILKKSNLVAFCTLCIGKNRTMYLLFKT